jgi:hypothetical protein
MKNPFTYLYYTGLLVLIVTLTFTTFFILKFSSILPSLLSQQGKTEYFQETEIIPKATSEIKESETLIIKPTVEKKQPLVSTTSSSSEVSTTSSTVTSTPSTEKKDSVVKLEEISTDTNAVRIDSTSQTPLEL